MIKTKLDTIYVGLKKPLPKKKFKIDTYKIDKISATPSPHKLKQFTSQINNPCYGNEYLLKKYGDLYEDYLVKT